MQLGGFICSHETKYQNMVQNVTELGPKSVHCIQIEGGDVCNKPI